MKTTELNGTEYKLTEGEGGKITLTPLREIIERRRPEGGDVWLENDGTNHIVVSSRHGLASAMFKDEEYKGDLYSSNFSFNDLYKPFEEDFTYLGKHHEVYVKIADIRAALSHKDVDGDSILNYGTLGDIHRSGLEKTRAALRKLNIFTK